jgi:hypothetical protein
VGVAPNLVLCEEVLIFLQLFFVPLEVLHHQVLAGEFVVIGKMVDDLVVCQPDA